jgi:hypothetical protein
VKNLLLLRLQWLGCQAFEIKLRTILGASLAHIVEQRQERQCVRIGRMRDLRHPAMVAVPDTAILMVRTLGRNAG